MCKTAVDVAFLVDGSGGVLDKNPFDWSWDSWEEIMLFLNNVTARLDPNQAHVGFVKYSSRENSRTQFTFTPARDVVTNRMIDRYQIRHVGGPTDTGSALRKVADDVIRGPNNRYDARDVVVLLTDGLPSVGDTDPGRLSILANDLRNSGNPSPVKLVMVGVSGGRSLYQNLRIVSDYADIVYAERFIDLRTMVEALLRLICPVALTYGETPVVNYPRGKTPYTA